MTPVALAANVRGSSRVLLVPVVLAAFMILVILAIAGAFATVPALHHTALEHTFARIMLAEGGPPPAH